MLELFPLDFSKLHRAILEDPADDEVRYALADWYERNGMLSRAASLRQEILRRATFRGPLPGPFDGRAICRRGFVDEAILELDTFLVHAAEIFGDHPITRVEFVDLDPEVDLFGTGTWCWITDYVGTDDMDMDLALVDHNLALIPDPLVGMLVGDEAVGAMFKGTAYGSHAEAIEALSRAAVTVGRSAAGLPPLVNPPTAVLSN